MGPTKEKKITAKNMYLNKLSKAEHKMRNMQQILRECIGQNKAQHMSSESNQERIKRMERDAHFLK